MASLAYVVWGPNEGRSSIRLLKVEVRGEPLRVGGPCAFYQVREIVDATIGSSKSVQHQHWQRWYKKYGRPPNFADNFCSGIGARPTDWLISIKQGAALNLSADVIQRLHTEVMCSGRMLIGHLVDWCSRLSKKAGACAANGLRDIFLKLASTKYSGVPEVMCLPPPRQGCGCCSLPPGDSDTCRHCFDVYKPFAASHPLLLERFPDLLVTVWRHRKKCVSMKVWADSLCKTAADILDSCFGPGCGWAGNGETVPALRCASRRARLDKNLMCSRMASMVSGGRVKSSSAAARAGVVDASVGAARGHMKECMRGYFSNTLKEFKDCKHLSMCFDESTVGKESTMVTALCAPLKRKVAWLVPRDWHVQLGPLEHGSGGRSAEIRRDPPKSAEQHGFGATCSAGIRRNPPDGRPSPSREAPSGPVATNRIPPATLQRSRHLFCAPPPPPGWQVRKQIIINCCCTYGFWHLGLLVLQIPPM